MKAPEKNASRLNQVWALPVRAERPLAMFLAVTMAAFAHDEFRRPGIRNGGRRSSFGECRGLRGSVGRLPSGSG